MSSKQVRPVGTGALYNTSRHALGICRRVCNTSRYSVSRQLLVPQSLESTIEDAVASVVMQQDALRVGVVGEESNEPYFSLVESMDMRDMIHWKRLSGSGKEYDDELLISLQGIHDSLWADLAARPGWEVIVHHTADAERSEAVVLDITFAFHHAYADGVASKLFHADLLKALNDSSAPPVELKDHALRFDSAPDLLPGMEALVPFKISWAYLLRTIWNEIIWQNLVPNFFKFKPATDSVPWTGKHIAVEPHQVNIRLIEIPHSALTAVVKACRQHGTTLTPLLHVVIAAHLARELPAGTAPVFSTVTPIDLRRYAKPGYDVQTNLAALVSAHDDVFDAQTLSRFRNAASEKDGYAGDFTWQTASSLSARLRAKVQSLPNDDIVAMMSFVSNWQNFWTDKLGTKRGSTWEVSNIGTVAGGDSEDVWSISRSIMTQGALPAGAAFSVNVAGVEGGPLCLSFTWQETIIEKELIEGLAGDLEKQLLRLANVSGP